MERITTWQIADETLHKWLERHGRANVAIITGKVSGLTILDCDDPSMAISKLFELFGETPIVVKNTGRWPSPLYYRYNGENNSPPEIPNIDIRGDRVYVIAPPSYNPQTGVSYSFILGDILDIKDLPNIKTLHLAKRTHIHFDIVSKKPIGHRNTSLFNHLINIAIETSSHDALLDEAIVFNQNFSEPLELKEARKAADSAWGYKLKDSIYPKGSQTIPLKIGKIKCIIY